MKNFLRRWSVPAVFTIVFLVVMPLLQERWMLAIAGGILGWSTTGWLMRNRTKRRSG